MYTLLEITYIIPPVLYSYLFCWSCQKKISFSSTCIHGLKTQRCLFHTISMLYDYLNLVSIFDSCHSLPFCYCWSKLQNCRFPVLKSWYEDSHMQKSNLWQRFFCAEFELINSTYKINLILDIVFVYYFSTITKQASNRILIATSSLNYSKFK